MKKVKEIIDKEFTIETASELIDEMKKQCDAKSLKLRVDIQSLFDMRNIKEPKKYYPLNDELWYIVKRKTVELMMNDHNFREEMFDMVESELQEYYYFFGCIVARPSDFTYCNSVMDEHIEFLTTKIKKTIGEYFVEDWGADDEMYESYPSNVEYEKGKKFIITIGDGRGKITWNLYDSINTIDSVRFNPRGEEKCIYKIPKQFLEKIKDFCSEIDLLKEDFSIIFK